MSTLLWLDTAADEAIDLGDPFALWETLGDMARLAGDTADRDFPDLFDLALVAEAQEDVDPAWLAAAREQAAAFRERFGDRLGGEAEALLAKLAGDP